jgi:hypothetical protein
MGAAGPMREKKTAASLGSRSAQQSQNKDLEY